MRSRHDRWIFRNNNIKRRKSLLESLVYQFADKNIPDGKLSNNNIVNQLVNAGKNKKTNTRKSKTGFRFKGGYGGDMKCSAHDQRQIADMDEQEREGT